MTYAYDDTNIFAMILRGEIPNSTVVETDHSLAFRDIHPQAPVHILLIPKGKYVTIDDFAANAGPEEAADFWATFASVIESEGLREKGFRVISNAGEHGLQEVPHFHLHILGGHAMGPILAR
ncbi:HIT domain-containing protein [Boseongicola aestuarii]|jgi:histidine triad (HIT) family protein|uniref:HIT-like protein HinT n=1 Tax=Boseongicola aestuarii TaxID=1470561 RepID=A0A238IWX4_9RHOB|nr:HIT domain-containing protein [Boseongicola aestuarii]SMX22968.1 HIT-like protein HinT [Boseongicola aestuarii]